MKRITVGLIILFVMSTMLIARDKTFTGRVIFIGQDYIEVKSGRTEKYFHIDGNSTFAFSKKNVTFADIEPCQVVRISYSVINDKMIIRTGEILRPNDCR